MQILVLNAGSSSLKYRVFGSAYPLAGTIERIGEEGSAVPDHHSALVQVLAQLQHYPIQLEAIGHRVVHGGAHFQAPTLIDSQVIATIRALIPLAPLHNPANLAGIEVAQALFPQLPQVAVFDTAFHQTLPPHAFHYALPLELYEQHHVRRYGFHGTSHQYVAQTAAHLLQAELSTLNLISLHLGNGCSATAIAAGQSVDTSMGFTPLEGLVMGTRSGDLDPTLPAYLMQATGWSASTVYHLLSHESGLKGLCGVSDMRVIEDRAQHGDARALLAEAVFAYRVKKYIGAYLAVLGRIDALIFTGGIGEHSARIRAACCTGLEALGLTLDAARNQALPAGGGAIHQHGSLPVLVIPTQEELAIAQSTAALVQQHRTAHRTGA